MATGLKPIQTQYAGCRFRSRIEARHAVFFDALKVRWDYEPEGFDLGATGRYLPDFFLPELNCWVEIKGQVPGAGERVKAEVLAQQSQQSVFIFYGGMEVPVERKTEHGLEIVNGTQAIGFGLRPYPWGGVAFKQLPAIWVECQACRGVQIVGIKKDGKPTMNGCGCLSASLQPKSSRMQNAYAKARGARFEFGEHGGR